MPFGGVARGERLLAPSKKAAPRGARPPRPAAIPFPPHALARGGLRQPRPRRLFVDVSGLELEQVEHAPRQVEEATRELGVQDLALLHGHLAVRPTYVAADHAPFQGDDGGAFASERDWLHLFSPRLTVPSPSARPRFGSNIYSALASPCPPLRLRHVSAPTSF